MHQQCCMSLLIETHAGLLMNIRACWQSLEVTYKEPGLYSWRPRLADIVIDEHSTLLTKKSEVTDEDQDLLMNA